MLFVHNTYKHRTGSNTHVYIYCTLNLKCFFLCTVQLHRKAFHVNALCFVPALLLTLHVITSNDVIGLTLAITDCWELLNMCC